MAALRIVCSLALLLGPLTLAACASCEAAEGEGEGEGEGQPDAGPDPDAVGLDERPLNPTCRAPDRPVLGEALAVTRPWPSLQVRSPLLMLQEPGAARMYVIERGGRIVRFAKDDAAVVTPEVFGDINVVTTDTGNDERGLLGMAFHPDWPEVEEVFLAYQGFGRNEAEANIVSRFRLSPDGTLDESSEEVLLFIDDFAGNHNGGMIAFSPTDPCRTCLYYGTGDGGFGGDPRENGQNPGTLLSKILRIDVARAEGGRAYGIPPDNPFVGVPDFLPEIWAMGFRNPWRWSFDRETGALWLGDVGQGAVEEIDLVEAGGNYGWNIREGTDCFDDRNGDCGRGGLIPPVTEYRHANGRISVTGGYVYRGAAVPGLAGTYLYADFGTGEIFALFFDAQGRPSPEVVLDLSTRIASFSEDRDGELYVLDHVTGRIERLVAAGSPPADDFPVRLSETGCTDPLDARRPASGLIPYGVNHPLYSDGADKDRWVALPDGALASILEDGDIDFPNGTVFMKDFVAAGKRVETRLLVRHDDGEWAGYSYEWDEAGTDAVLVAPGGKTRTLANGLRWSFPSRNGCLACHTDAGRRVLGFEIAQLNGGFFYEATGRLANQLKTLDAIGLFDGPLPGALQDLPALAPLTSPAASVEEKARSYLHVNCAICHQPGGIGVANTDWRAHIAFGDMALCDVPPSEGDLGVVGARRLAPGDPERSLLSIRMKKLGAGRMPLLGSNVVDGAGTAAIDQWIRSVLLCP
jgi:uncharacterized repeat protein (TIGR03806 family)